MGIEIDMSIIIESLIRYSLPALIGAIIAGYIFSAISGYKLVGVIMGVIVGVSVVIGPIYMGQTNEKYTDTNMITESNSELHSNQIKDMKYCPFCGNKISENKLECDKCHMELTN